MAKRFRTPSQMLKAWREYCDYCDHHTIVEPILDKQTLAYVNTEKLAPITCTIKGFCVWLGMTETNFYITYNRDERFKSAIAQMRDECEQDARAKFEAGVINSRLAGLWMSNYGYTTKTETKAEVRTDKLDQLASQLMDDDD